MHTSRPYLTTLTPLRGIAALIVVIFHSNLMLMFTPVDKPNLITIGWLWVDFFFVLSGFIIYYVYGRSFQQAVAAKHYWKYIRARFARVYPLHLATLLWCFACALIIMRYGTSFHPFFRDMYDPMAVVPSLFLIQALGLYTSAPLNSPSWSLSTEWWVYMIFPFLVPFFHRLRSIGKVATLIAIAGSFLLLKYYLGAVGIPFPGGSPSINVITDYGIIRCLAGFLLGMFLFRLYQDSFAINFLRQSWVFALFFVGTLIAMHLGAEDVLIVAFFPAVILSAAYNDSSIKKILDMRPLQKLGDWSFSIYMVHMPIIFIFWTYQTVNNPSLWAQFPPVAPPLSMTEGLTMCVALVVLTLLVASVCYRFIEVPTRSFLNPKVQS